MSTALMVTYAQAQELPVALDSISPAEGQPDQELEVTLRGRGFGEANEVRLIIGELEVWESWVVSNGQMGAIIYIPEDAPPGPRDVEVLAVFGPNEEFPAVLVSGFTVLERAAPPPEEISPPEPPFPEEFEEPPDLPEDSFNGWDLLLLLLIGGILFVGGTVVLILSLLWRRAVVRRKWQTQATESELPQTCRAGTHFIRRERPDIKPGRWKITGLNITVYDASSRAINAVQQAPSNVIKNLDNTARQRLLLGMSESLVQQLQQTGENLTESILALQAGSKTGDDIYMQTKLEGGQAEQKFIRYRCVGTPGGWQKQGEWSLKLSAMDHLPRTMRGPGEGESPEAYAAFLREQVHAYLLELLEEARTMF